MKRERTVMFESHAAALEWIESLGTAPYPFHDGPLPEGWPLKGGAADRERDLLGCFSITYRVTDPLVLKYDVKVGEILVGPSTNGRYGVWAD